MSAARGTRHALLLAALVAVTSAHVGSPDVFFTGKAGAYDINVVVRPPMVVPGVARVTVRAPANVQRVSIRPVFWRAGSKGAPSADETKTVGGSGTFEGSLWLMARGAYSVDVIVEGLQGKANVLVPVASVATGTLAMDKPLGAVLILLAIVLVAGMVTIVYKAAGESLLDASDTLDSSQRAFARRAAAVSIPVIAGLVFLGARWWNSVDADYDGNIYRPPRLSLTLEGSRLELKARDPLYYSRGISRYMPDHGKTMHLFLVKADDARGFAHLHPQELDTTANPALATQLPPLPAGTYHVYGDVVHETGFERTLVGSLDLPARQPANPPTRQPADPDDSWFEGDAETDREAKLADGSTMGIELRSSGPPRAGEELVIRVSVRDASGKPAKLEPYLGMAAHGVVARLDGQVYVHLHPMGTITMAAQEAFAVRDRGDTTTAGRLILPDHAVHTAKNDSTPSIVDFPYAFPRSGSYRLFVQVKRNGRILTGAFAIPVDSAAATR